MNAERCACCGRGVRKKTRGGPRVKDVRRGEEDRGNEEERLRYPRSPEAVPSHRFVVPVCATRCGLTQKDPGAGAEQQNAQERERSEGSRWQNEKSACIYRADLRRRRRRRPRRRRHRRRGRRRRRWNTYTENQGFLVSPYCLADSRPATASDGYKLYWIHLSCT